jgi:hypothetical protein
VCVFWDKRRPETNFGSPLPYGGIYEKLEEYASFEVKIKGEANFGMMTAV